MNAAVDTRDELRVVAEAGVYLTVLLAGTVAALLGWMTVQQATVLALLLLIGLLVLTWQRLDHGRHPCFLFVGMLLLFQCGRLLVHALGLLPEPFRIQLATSTPFDVDRSAALMTLLLITLSAICVYVPCRWNPRSVRLLPGAEQSWLAPAYVVFFATLVFDIYKNYVYLSYVRSHGGYLVVFTDNAAVVASAGFPVRVMAQIAYTLFFVIFLMDRNRKRLWAVTLVFIGISMMELLIGFRGKFFLLIIVLWFLANLKSGKRFHPAVLVGVALLISVTAVVTGSYRENRTASVVSPAGFIATQGISMQVTESVVAFPRTFQDHILAYLLSDVRGGFVSAIPDRRGESLEVDLSTFLNPRGLKAGYATGSAYLAELYLLGGAVAVILGSVAIGFALRWMHAVSSSFAGAVALSIFLPLLIYLPRAGLLAPIGAGLKSVLSLAAVTPIIILLRLFLDVLSRPARS